MQRQGPAKRVRSTGGAAASPMARSGPHHAPESSAQRLGSRAAAAASRVSAAKRGPASVVLPESPVSSGQVPPSKTAVHTRVEHVRQERKWDCGLACVIMVLRAGGIHKTRPELAKMAGTSSTWTVDLAYIMRSCGAKFVFLTMMEGVREDYSAEAFYRDDLDADRLRVEKLFRGASLPPAQ